MSEALLHVVLVLTFIPSATFATIYTLRPFFTEVHPWWRTWEGRALVASASGWAWASAGMLLQEWTQHDAPNGVWIVVGISAATSAWMKLGLLVTPRRDDA